MSALRYLSLCSGIEAASVAWGGLGWEPVAFAEVEPFPCAVLAYHYPDVPNLGDMTQIDGRKFLDAVDILVAGTPCQAFSVAGARRGLEDKRGNLTLKFVEIANEISPAIIIWENVPGVLSMHDNAFGCFLGGLAGCEFAAEPGPPPPVGKSSKYWRWDRRGERHIPTWPAAGVTVGPERAIAWRTLDAQYFGLAQRRRRVFVVACPRKGPRPEQILFEFEGLRRDTPPSRQAPEEVASTLEAGIGRSRGSGTPHCALIATQTPAVPDVAGTMNTARWKNGATMAAGYMVPCSQYGTVAASLTSEGADASPCADRGPTVLAVRTAQTSANGNGVAEEVSHTLDRTNGQAVIAFHGSQDPDVSGEITHPLGSNHGLETCVCEVSLVGRGVASHAHSHWNGGPHPCLGAGEHSGGIGMSDQELFCQGGAGLVSNRLVYAPPIVEQAVSCKWSKGTSGPAGDEHHNLVASLAFTERGRKEGRTLEYLPEQAYCLMNPGSGGRTHSRQIMTPQLQVRRLTPCECERLQGFPDGYTDVPYRGKPAADGPRYRAIGNSMAVNVMRWIGERIAQAMAAKNPKGENDA